jgi:bifunctional UDP-N-acetylglucosamine pyrophosphorylase/glucosamine-1-phosphate N-acetyltransferase
MKEQIVSIILAAGKGTRMHSQTPKVLHKICGWEMIRYALQAAPRGEEAPVAVIGHGADLVRETLGGAARYAYQAEQKGTGHAVMVAREYLEGRGGYAVILAGDMPLLRRETLESLIEKVRSESAAAGVLTCMLENPAGYGRIVRSGAGLVQKIVEHRDANEAERAIREVNTSVYCFEIPALLGCLDRLTTANAQGEYYLTDCIGMLAGEGRRVTAMTCPAEEGMGVNDRVQLAKCAKIMQRRINEGHMLAGVQILDPDSTWISPEAAIEADAVIYPGNVIEGESFIGRNALLYPGNFIENARIGEGCKVGPNAHLRPRTVLGPNCRVGNFVELKNVTLDEGSKVSHLAYCGDGSIGKKCNISCGVIFSNYDGKHKFRTEIGDNVFVGCNANLVAPVQVQDGAYIAAGSTITQDVPAGALGIARSRQTNKEGWAQRRAERKE